MSLSVFEIRWRGIYFVEVELRVGVCLFLLEGGRGIRVDFRWGELFVGGFVVYFFFWSCFFSIVY